MPLARVEVRNEYGLGAPELYAAANKEDPKEVLQGVAVAGLVGILRQLGDLAEFAAEVFHGLQEQVMITSSRSHKLMGRVKQLEAALPPLEKLILAQRSHLHFAYTAGTNWHVRRRCEQSHFIYSDLPRFIQDSYEQCRGPPHLNLLDKFDPGGPGSCLKRYSDPSFFRRASTGSDAIYSDKVLKDKKGRKIKKRRSSRRNGEVSRGPSISNYGRRTRFTPLNVEEHISPSQTVSMYDAVKSDLGDQPISLDSRNGSVDFESVSHPRYSMQHEEQEFRESFSSSPRMQNNDSLDYAFSNGKGATLFDDVRSSLSGEKSGPGSFSATWNGKAETLESESDEHVQNETSEAIDRNFNLENEGRESTLSKNGEGYGREISLEIEEGTTCFQRGKCYGVEKSLEASSINIDLENVDGATHFGRGFIDDESLMTNIDLETKIGDAHSLSIEGYDNDEPLQTFSGIPDLQINDSGDHYNLDGSFRLFSTNLDQETEGSRAIHFKIPRQLNIHLDNENLLLPVADDIQSGDFNGEAVVQKNCDRDSENEPVPISVGLQQEDVESETDHYVDALNTIESEYDTDLESQTRQEVEHYSDTESNAAKHAVYTLVAASSSSNNDPFEVRPNPMFPEISALCSSPDKVTSEDISSLVPFESFAPQPAELGNASSNPNILSDFDSLRNGGAIRSSSNKDLFEVSPNLMLPKTSALCGSPDKVKPEDISSLVPFESFAPQPAELDNESSNPNILSDFDSLRNGGAIISSSNKNLFEVSPNLMLPKTYALCGSPDKVKAEDISSLVPFESFAPQPAELDNKSSNPNTLSDFDSLRNGGAISSSSNNDLFEVSPNLMSPKTSALCGSPEKVKPKDISNLVHFESFVPQSADEPLNPNSLSGFDSLRNGDTISSSNVKSAMNNMSSFNSKKHASSAPITGMCTNSSSELQKPPPEPSSTSSIKFWTNGGLLGLEPSKPPDFAVPNVSNQVTSTSKDSDLSSSTQKPDTSDKNPENIQKAPTMECFSSCQDDRKGGILTKKSSWTSLSADLSVNLQKLTGSCYQSYNNSSQKDCFSQNSGTMQPVTPDIDSTRTSQEKNGNSSRMFELSNRLILNGFYGKSLLEKDETSHQSSSSNDSAFELKNSHGRTEHKTFSGRSKMQRSRSPILSPSSSPPLGHMKMSFQPIHGFEPPKLQLKFPDQNFNHESGKDLFPSFQLVPDPTVPLDDVGSDSDDDTFCRSSPYGSDCPTHQSDSNSEQWESSESPRSKDQELYDALCRISLTESVSSTRETRAATQGEINSNSIPHHSLTRQNMEYSESSHLFDLPGLDSIQSSLEEEWRNQCHPKDYVDPHCTRELTPSPPPLPPPQWRAMKSQIELVEDGQISMSENLSHEFDWKLGCTITQQPKPAPVKQEQIIEAAHTLKNKPPDFQKIRVQKEGNGQVNLKEMEEKEDFLHQIRTKSFSLRRTETAKLTVPTGNPTSFQVRAILQKANAIRQAVGSDDGEDDNWSDT